MDFRKLNRRITIITPGVTTPTALGGVIEGIATEVSTYCSAEQLSMREMELYGLAVGIASYRFIFRYESAKNITQLNSLRYENRLFRIIAVKEVKEAKDQIEIIANEQL